MRNRWGGRSRAEPRSVLPKIKDPAICISVDKGRLRIRNNKWVHLVAMLSYTHNVLATVRRGKKWMDQSINTPAPVRYKSRETRTSRPNLRTDPFPAPVAGVVGFVAGVDQTAMTGTVVEPVAAAVERTTVVSVP